MPRQVEEAAACVVLAQSCMGLHSLLHADLHVLPMLTLWEGLETSACTLRLGQVQSAYCLLMSADLSGLQEWEAALAANRMHMLPVPVFEGRTQDGKANGQSLVELAAKDDMVDL